MTEPRPMFWDRFVEEMKTAPPFGDELVQVAFADRIMAQVGGIPCAGHEDFAAGTWTFHREGECPR